MKNKDTKFKAKDISNFKFGRLTALYPTDKRDKDNGSVIWRCECKCGNFKDVAEYLLVRKDIRSCGCLEKESRQNNGKKVGASHVSKNIVDGTNIQALKIPLLSTNTSGIKGVTWDKSRKKWVAQINFMRKHIFLGRFGEIEDAAKARKEAEEKYFKPILEKYRGEK
ncbi:AP2 domain-containing protein [Acetobacterium paludosum]|uniref:AP2 domain-containing protein n=1 Tax=Acetobacterium paludosum TaxID=52693 RepID=A0A923KYA8_9FIRM|nr:AP2/ERF family transcription factor [Acetobacterium paludosum]MBC3889431.1 AP2 domain-containing protein [Acetobacterium paludosum]